MPGPLPLGGTKAKKDNNHDKNKAGGQGKDGLLQDDDNVAEVLDDAVELIIDDVENAVEGMDEAEVAEEAEAEVEDGKKKRKKTKLELKDPLRVLEKKAPWESQLPEDRDRYWELMLSVSGFQNVSSKAVSCFFAASVCPDSKKTRKPKVRLATQFTPIYHLDKNQEFVFPNPFPLYFKKHFSLSYKELENYVVKIDQWKYSCWTFNEYHSWRKRKLSIVASSDPNFNLMLKKKPSKADLEQQLKGGPRRQIPDMALFRFRVDLEEVFDFALTCDNWTLTLNQDMDDEMLHKYKKERKRLTFLVPENSKSAPGQRNIIGAHRSKSYTTEWNRDESKFFWSTCGNFKFRGTRTNLATSYFLVWIHSSNPMQIFLESEELQKAQPALRVLGLCLLNLTSVLSISVFKGEVKKFDTDKKKYLVGELSGNMRCELRSKGITSPELEFRGKRPEQQMGSTTVGHLKRLERHLVVRVKKCESLPVADQEQASSDPYLRVTWDNMVMTSQVIPCSLRPVFNQNFYFPVRIVFPQLQKASNERKYMDSVLKFELLSKGHIKIEVWDDDTTSADYLGGTILTLHEIFSVRSPQKMTLLGPVKPSKEEEEEEDLDAADNKTKQWYEQEKEVRVYDGSKTTLGQTMLSNTSTALIHFDAFFWPDYDNNLRLDADESKNQADTVWGKKEHEWNDATKKFAEEYARPFPDSIGAKKCVEEMGAREESYRRFLCIGMHPQRRWECPLMSFLSPIIVPEAFSQPATLLAWVYNLCFEVSSKQTRTGLIPRDGWKDCDVVLARRKGAVQDHAVLLCSLLMGSKKDAYVCKGTIYADHAEGITGQRRLLEHTWVMTREDGWVTFWEPCSRQVFHLPNRYQRSKAALREARRFKKKRAKDKNRKKGKGMMEEDDEEQANEDAGGADQGEEEEEEDGRADKRQWEGEAEDVKISIQEMEALPTVGRMPKPKSRVANKKKEDGREMLRKELMQKRQSLAIAPNQDLLKPENVVSWLPYDSIEVIFNGTNLYANRQNHHPACIRYTLPHDFDEDEGEQQQNCGWEPLIKEGNAKDEELEVTPISPNVSVQPTLKSNIVDNLKQDLWIEMQQNLQLYRGKRGHDTLFDHSDELMKRVKAYLDILEHRFYIDVDSPAVKKFLEPQKDKDDSKKAEEEFIRDHLDIRRWNKHGSIFFEETSPLSPLYDAYRKEQEQKWTTLLKKVREFLNLSQLWPTKRGKRFRGFPVHFSTSDPEQIRNYLMQIPLYNEFINSSMEDIFYTIEVQLYAHLGGVLSVWLYIGLQDVKELDEND